MFTPSAQCSEHCWVVLPVCFHHKLINCNHAIVCVLSTPSQLHAALNYDQDEDLYYIRDRGSVAGTFLNGKRLSQVGWVGGHLVAAM